MFLNYIYFLKMLLKKNKNIFIFYSRFLFIKLFIIASLNY